MRNELFTEKLGIPVRNNVLVEVTDHFDQIETESGILLPNMSHEESKGDSPGYSFSEFSIRYGKVINIPTVIYPGSFDYNTECEVLPGDIVYWNYFSFLNHQPLVMDDRKFLLVDYHDIMFRIRDDKMVPVNGNALFTPVVEAHTYGAYTNIIRITDQWKIYLLPEKMPEFLNPRHYTNVDWEIGDVVYLAVADKPFKVEGDIVKNLEEELYACPVRMIWVEVKV